MARGMLSAVGHKLEPQTSSTVTHITYTLLLSCRLSLPSVSFYTLFVFFSLSIYLPIVSYMAHENGKQRFLKAPLRELFAIPLSRATFPFLSPLLF